MTVAIYSRVSTADQNDEAQFQELVELCRRSDWKVVGVFRETASGVRGVDDRPKLKELLLGAKRRQFKKVIVWSADRLARSTRHLMYVLGELHDCKVDVFSYKQGVDTSTPLGAMLWQFLGIFAEFEHGIRRERQGLGIAKAQQRGVRFGRPRISVAKRREIVDLRLQGLGINKIARQLKVGTGSVISTLQKQGLGTRLNEHGFLGE